MADEPGEDLREVSPDEARALLGEGAQLVDVRAAHEWEGGHISGALHLPLDQLGERIEELDKDRPVVLYCRGGTRSSMATEALAASGYEAMKLTDGVVGWAEAGLPIDPEGGYAAESGEAASILQARKRAAQG